MGESSAILYSTTYTSLLNALQLTDVSPATAGAVALLPSVDSTGSHNFEIATAEPTQDRLRLAFSEVARAV